MKRILAVFAITLPLTAQWLDYPHPNSPRLANGKPNLSAPAPRMNGKPDLTGLWQAERTPESEFAKVMGPNPADLQVDLADVTKHFVNLFWDTPPGQEPMKPEASEILKQRATLAPPSASCLPDSLPRNIFVLVRKFIQAPRELVILHENGDPAREIFTDGRSLPKDPQPSWNGYSVGKWQGETLVVETIGIKEASWLDEFGHPHSEGAKIRESYRRRDFGHMDLEITIEDPVYYTRPFGLKTTLNLVPDSEILDYVCNENEKDRAHTSR